MKTIAIAALLSTLALGIAHAADWSTYGNVRFG